jgi:hypothetical protein
MALTRSRSLASDLLDRLLLLPGTRGGVALFIAYVLAAIVCCFLPLADHIGFELAAVLTILAALIAPAVGAAAIRLDRPRPRGDRSPARAAASAGLYAILLLVFPIGILLLNAVRRPSCEPISGGMWLLVLPVPTAFLAATLGALGRSLTASGRWIAAFVLLVEGVSLAAGLSTLYTGPSFFLYDHFFGYFPGPLYDEVVLVSHALLVFRALTLLWAMVLILVCAALGAEWPGERNRAAGWALLLGAGLLIISRVEGTHFGYRTTDASLADALGGVRQIDQLEIHYPREWSDKSVDAFARDAAFRASQVIEELQLTHPPKVKVWVYRSAEEKRQLVGAANTSFSKPWRHEVHINSAGSPHPVIRHELVHAFAGDIAPRPFGTPGGLIPNSPLTEGFAVALDLDDDGLTLPQWAKAMRELHIAPDVTTLFSTASFYAAAPARAYQYAGAFLRYLDGRFGRPKLLELYATGDLSRLGKPADLVKDFNQFLESVKVTSAERATAERQLAHPSVFRRRCAREVSQLSDEAQRLLSEGRTQDALAEYDHLCALEPDDPALLQSLLRAAVKAKDTDLRDKTVSRILSHSKSDPVLRATTLLEVGDDDWRRRSLTDAARHYREAAEIPTDAATHRLAIVKSTAVRDPALSSLLEPLLVESEGDVPMLFALNDYIQANPYDRLVHYLLGRQLVQRDAPGRGLSLLESAGDNLLDDSEMSTEVARLLVRTYSQLHRCADAQQALRRLTAPRGSEDDRVVAEDWIARCRFEVSRGWKPWSDRAQD